jgi:hypothetical protein
VRENWSTPDLTGLSPAARTDVAHHLAYYLYLHRAAYGPTPVAALDPQEPSRFAHGVLEGEAALLRLEILKAAGKPEAEGIEKAILERWPGLSWRVEEIQRGGAPHGASHLLGRRAECPAPPSPSLRPPLRRRPAPHEPAPSSGGRVT